MIVIIPSNRSINLKYLTPLIDSGARFIIIDDSEGSIKVNHPQFEVYNWNDRKKMLGPLEIGFPRQNGACRDFGFYIAWKNSNPEEIIIALDDDCEVYQEDFCIQIEKVLSAQPRPVVTCLGDHLNIMDLYRDVSNQLFPRGFPYSSRVKYSGIEVLPPESRNVTFGLGLWKGVFDINGMDKIEGPEYSNPNAELLEPSVLVENGKYVSLCSMNMYFRRELVPAIYQLPMHIEVMPGWVVDRYGDIWGGFILQTLMGLRNENIAVGEPMINHLKEGEFLRNIWQEHICHLINDEFFAMLLEVKEQIRPDSYLNMMKEIHEGFKQNSHKASSLFEPYLNHLCKALDAWTISLS